MTRLHPLFAFSFDPSWNPARLALDRAASILDARPQALLWSGFPAYDVVQLDDERIELRLAVSGYDRKDLEIEIEDGHLRIASAGQDAADQPVFLHRGVARRAFERRFALADGIEVDGARLENGILTIAMKVAKNRPSVRRVEIAA